MNQSVMENYNFSMNLMMDKLDKATTMTVLKTQVLYGKTTAEPLLKCAKDICTTVDMANAHMVANSGELSTIATSTQDQTV